MKRGIHLFVIILLSLLISRFSFAQTPEESIFKDTSVKIGVGFEFFNNELFGDPNEQISVAQMIALLE